MTPNPRVDAYLDRQLLELRRNWLEAIAARKADSVIRAARDAYREFVDGVLQKKETRG